MKVQTNKREATVTPLSTYLTVKNKNWLKANAKKQGLPLWVYLDNLLTYTRARG